jgi:hypothetical protein
MVQDSCGESLAGNGNCWLFGGHPPSVELSSMAADDNDLPTTYLLYAAIVILMLVAAVISTFIIIFH